MIRAVGAFLARVPPDVGRFLLAGGGAAAVNWLVRFPLSAVMPFEAAIMVAYGIGMCVGFAAYRAWVFPGSTLPVRVQVTRFLAVNAAGSVVVLACAKALAPVLLGLGVPLGASRALAHGLAIGAGAVVSFAGHRLVTFAGRETA